MELHVTKRKGRKIVVLLDNDMRIVKPVYDYLKYQDQRDRAINTLIAYGNDLKAFWEFLSEFGYTYDEVSPKMIGEYKEYLMSEDDNIIAINKEGARTAKTINRMLSTYSAAYDKLKKVQKEVGIDFNFHDLRHTFCSNLVQSGMDVSVVRMIMGHEHLSTTQKYTHISNPYIEDSLSRYWNQSTLIGGDSDGK